MLLDRYLKEVEATVLQAKNIYVERYEEEIVAVDRVNLRIRVRFQKGRILELNEAVIGEAVRPRHLGYRYHFKDEQKTKEKLGILKLPCQERRAYDRYVDDLHYQASMVESSYGIGKLRDRKEGREEGREEERIKMAVNSLEIFDDSTIAEKTGLPLKKNYGN